MNSKQSMQRPPAYEGEAQSGSKPELSPDNLAIIQELTAESLNADGNLPPEVATEIEQLSAELALEEELNRRNEAALRETEANLVAGRVAIDSLSRRPKHHKSQPHDVWPQFEPSGLELDPVEETLKDGRHLLHMVPSKQHFINPNDDPRVIFRLNSNGDEAILLGLFVPEKKRGREFGSDLIKYFLRALDRKDIRFGGTDRIHKPGIALLLKRAGLEPEPGGVEAVLLTPKLGDDPDVPKVVLQNGHDLLAGKRGKHGQGFYTVIPRSEVLEPLDPDAVVSLHTRYRQPKK